MQTNDLKPDVTVSQLPVQPLSRLHAHSHPAVPATHPRKESAPRAPSPGAEPPAAAWGPGCYALGLQEPAHDIHEYSSPKTADKQNMANTGFEKKENRNKQKNVLFKKPGLES